MALAAIPSILGPFLILLFCPLDQIDVYNEKGTLFTADGKYYKAATRHNFHVMKSEHLAGGTPSGRSADGIWGTTQHVGALTWSTAIVALPTLIGPFIILLFMPLDNHDIYKDEENLYLADGSWYKTASSKNFDIRRSAHTINGAPNGLSDGIWGTTTYVGPRTLSLFICALPTVIGAIIILMFFPVDRSEVYNVDGRLYLPNGTVYKNATSSNFYIRKSEHTLDGAPHGLSGGEWGTTTYVGPLCISLFICALPSIVGAILILMFLPLDSEEVYKTDGNLYLADGTMYKAATGLNFYQKNSKHIRPIDEEEDTTAELL